MRSYQSPLRPDGYYHIYGRTVDGIRMFKTDENYNYFLKKYMDYLDDYLSTLAYCLMPNHFHFLIKVKDRNTLTALIKSHFHSHQNLSESQFACSYGDISRRIAKQFSHFFNSYAQSLNKQLKRKGPFFSSPYNRVEIDTQQQLMNTIVYIHLNPVSAGMAKGITDWKYASFKAITSKAKTKIDREEVLNIFGGKREFLESHFKDEGGEVLVLQT